MVKTYIPKLSANNPSAELYTLQMLRAQAAILVVIAHLSERYLKYGISQNVTLPDVGAIGVGLFFVISGFIITRTTETSFGRPGAATGFLTKRAIRIVPLYFIFTTLYILKLTSMGDKTSFGEVVCSYLFLPYRGSNGLLQPVYGVGWTLNFEMYFYLIFGASLFFRRAIGVTMAVAVLGTFFIVATVVPTSTNLTFDALQFWGQPIVFYFAAGILVALLSRGCRLAFLPVPVGIGLASAAMCAAIIFREQPVFVVMCCVAAVTLAALEAPSAASRRRSAIKFLGDASYSIYLTHSFVLGPAVAAILAFDVHDYVGVSTLSLLCVLLCLIVGGVVHATIDVPLQLRLRQWARQPKKCVAAAPSENALRQA